VHGSRGAGVLRPCTSAFLALYFSFAGAAEPSCCKFDKSHLARSATVAIASTL
jgi:hypothetical protein